MSEVTFMCDEGESEVVSVQQLSNCGVGKIVCAVTRHVRAYSAFRNLLFAFRRRMSFQGSAGVPRSSKA